MPTDKRERQRAGREARRAAARQAQMRAARRRQLLTVGALVGVVVVVALAIRFSGGGSSPSASSSKKDSVSCPPATATGSKTRHFQFASAPPNCLSSTSDYSAVVKTDAGSFTIGLDRKAAPKTVNNFVFLSRYHAYDGIPFHRVIPGFVVQGGDVQNKGGTGGPGYTFADELPQAGAYKVGSVAMANSGPDTNGSQFFVITGDQGVALPPSYSLFGTVLDGLDVVQKIEADGSQEGTPKVTHTIESVTINEKKG